MPFFLHIFLFFFRAINLMFGKIQFGHLNLILFVPEFMKKNPELKKKIFT